MDTAIPAQDFQLPGKSSSDEQQVQMIIQQPDSVPGMGQAYDGAVSAGSLGLEVFEGLAVIAAIPAILFAGKCARGRWCGVVWRFRGGSTCALLPSITRALPWMP